MRFLAQVESGHVPGGRIGASGIVLERKSDVFARRGAFRLQT